MALRNRGGGPAMGSANQLKFQGCKPTRTSDGFQFYTLEMTEKTPTNSNMIKIYHIGKPNSYAIKNFLLIGLTGSGKTTLLNSLCNHIYGVQFTDKHRLKICEEKEETKMTYDSQSEYITGYLFHYEPGMRYHYNIMIIDTPGIGDTTGENMQNKLFENMQQFLKDEKFGVLDLHFMGYVINATTNRNFDNFKQIVKEFMKMFGKDTVEVTYALATHANRKMKNAEELLKSWGVKTKNIFNFENACLYEPNLKAFADSDNSLSMSRIQWDENTKEYNKLFAILEITPSLSLRLTRAVLKEKAFLEQGKHNLVKHIINAFITIVANKQTLKINESASNCMCFEKKKTKVSVEEESMWYQWAPHVHNCLKCEQTCSGICHFWIACVRFPKCQVCQCSETDHEESTTMIKETFMQVPSHKLKQSEVDELIEDEEKCKVNIANMINFVSFQTTRLSKISLIPVHQSPKELLKQLLEAVLKKYPELHEKQRVLNIKELMQSIINKAEKIKGNEDDWNKNIDKHLNSS